MNKNSLRKILDFFIEFFYLGAVFVIPIYFCFFPRTFNVFELGKMVWLRIFVLSFIVLSIVKIVLEKNFIKKNLQFIKAQIKYFYIPFLFLGSLIIVTIFSSLRSNSFWGSYDFQFGLYSYLYFFIFFVFLSFSLDEENKLRRIIYAIFFSSFLVCLYGVAQILKIDPITWTEEGGRAFSTLGQPNFLASYLLLTFPVSIYLFFNSGKRSFKYFALFVGFLHLLCLYFTYSRGGQLGLVLGVFFFGVAFFIMKKNEKFIIFFKNSVYRKYLIISLVVLFFLLVGIWSNQKDRVRDIFNFRSGSVASRIDYYQAGYKAFLEKPFLGYGLANQKEVYARYYQPDWAIHNSVNKLPYQAHNIFLDCLIQGGVLLLFSWLALNIYFLYLSLRLIRFKKNQFLSTALLFGWLCYTLSLFFGFAVITTEFYFWTFLAIVLSQFINFKKDVVLESQNSIIFERFIIVVKIILVVLLLLFLGYRYTREIKIIIADHYFYQLQSSWAKEKYYEAFVFNDWLDEIGTEKRQYDQEIGEMFSSVINKKDNSIWSKAAKKLVLPKILKNINEDSYDSVCARAKIYSVLSLDDAQHQAKAEEYFNDCLKRGENIPENYREYARYFYNKNDYEKAVYYLEQAQVRLPGLDSFGLNEEHRRKIELEIYLINLIYGDIYFEENDLSKAEDYYNRAADFDSNKIVKKKIADIYYARHDLDGTIKIIEDIRAQDGGYYYWPYLIAMLYREKGELVLAEKYAVEAGQLQEKNEEIKKFLEEIRNEL